MGYCIGSQLRIRINTNHVLIVGFTYTKIQRGSLPSIGFCKDFYIIELFKFFQILLPMLAPLADLMLILSLLWNRDNPASLHKIELYYLVFFAVDILVSVIAFAFEKERFSKLWWLIPQRFVYRQLMYVILFKAIRKAIQGESQGWGILKRTGNVKQLVSAATS